VTGAANAALERVGPSQTLLSASAMTRTSPPDPQLHKMFNGGRIRASAGVRMRQTCREGERYRKLET
jgi:hypothetical protein